MQGTCENNFPSEYFSYFDAGGGNIKVYTGLAPSGKVYS